MDLTKRDLELHYGGRIFGVRAYRDGSGPDGPVWQAIIIEDRTPLRHGQAPHASLTDCVSGAVEFLVTLVESQAEAAPIPA